MARRNIYKHSIDLEQLKIKNADKWVVSWKTDLTYKWEIT